MAEMVDIWLIQCAVNYENFYGVVENLNRRDLIPSSINGVDP